MLPIETTAAYEFGEFRLDCGRFELTHKGRPLRLERKPMELLILLVSSNGRLVARNEIAQRLWDSEVFVDTEHGINTAIRKIRQALGDDPEEPRFVHTVTGRGYRFVADVRAIAERDEVAAPAGATPSTADLVAAPVLEEDSARGAGTRRTGLLMAGALGVVSVLGAGSYLVERLRPHPVEYTRITDFTDSAVAPALSPDGRMLAFIRGKNDFTSADPIYVKMLPDAEPKLVTDDPRSKYGLSFSPDGSQIAYAVMTGSDFDTYTVPVLGGKPQLLLRNAAVLHWLDKSTLLYSRFMPGGIHMEAVVGDPSGAIAREVYVPPFERAMAHYALPSPDHRSALIVEMNENGGWGPCRLAAMEGTTAAKNVGPNGGCTAAGWSPDGNWMYFTAYVDGRSHLWRQRFPDGEPQAVTSGPSEEFGIAMDPDGRSLITSVGTHQSSIWIHDERGDRPLSSEGDVDSWAMTASYGPDAKVLYYLLRRGRPDADAELWETMLDTGNSEAVLPGVSMLSFNLSPDGKRVVYASRGADGKPRLWTAPIDRSAPPTKVGELIGLLPVYGRNGLIYFQVTEGRSNYLEQAHADGSSGSRVVPYAITDIDGISPSRRWLMLDLPSPPFGGGPSVAALSTEDASARPVCKGYCVPAWSVKGDYLFLSRGQSSRNSPGESLAIPVGQNEDLARIPGGGVDVDMGPASVPGSTIVARYNLVPGVDPAHYAYVNESAQRNLYRVTLP